MHSNASEVEWVERVVGVSGQCVTQKLIDVANSAQCSMNVCFLSGTIYQLIELGLLSARVFH